MSVAILVRVAGFEDQLLGGELDAIAKHFPLRRSLDEIQPGDEIMGRFSLKPFYADVEGEIKRRGAQMIVPAAAHAYIEDLGAWYIDFADITPKTWLSIEAMDADGYTGPVFIKGRTYSRKHDWNTHAYAPAREDVDRITANIKRDALYGAEDLVYRQFINLKTYDHTDRGLPITCEWRYFLLDGQIASVAYYWSSFGEVAPADRVDERIVQEAARRLKERGVRWCVADFALTESGETIMIELNDPSMTGLSATDPDAMYARMREILS